MVSRGQSPWDVLGIEAGAGASEVRRAYAKRLKEIRPDEDAEGFQKLVEGRDMALQLASGVRHEVPSTVVLFADTVDAAPDLAISLELPRSERATNPPTASAADASPEISAPPAQPTQDVLDILRTALSADHLAGCTPSSARSAHSHISSVPRWRRASSWP